MLCLRINDFLVNKCITYTIEKILYYRARLKDKEHVVK